LAGKKLAVKDQKPEVLIFIANLLPAKFGQVSRDNESVFVIRHFFLIDDSFKISHDLNHDCF
jgi:hypothetical protein